MEDLPSVLPAFVPATPSFWNVLERIHRVTREARKRRGLVGNGVVNARPHGGGGVRGGEARRVVREQRVNRTEEAVCAQDAAEDRHAAEGEGTEAAREGHLRFTTEETASLLGVKITGVGFNPGFEHKAELQTVSEIFRILLGLLHLFTHRARCYGRKGACFVGNTLVKELAVEFRILLTAALQFS